MNRTSHKQACFAVYPTQWHAVEGTVCQVRVEDQHVVAALHDSCAQLRQQCPGCCGVQAASACSDESYTLHAPTNTAAEPPLVQEPILYAFVCPC